jgi:hypothetical protein
LQVGCLLLFRYKVDEDMRVNVFDDSSCRRHYQIDESDKDIDVQL